MRHPKKKHSTPAMPNSARKGDAKEEAVANRAADTVRASRLANLLEGIRFPATKKEIQMHLDAKPPSVAETDDFRSSVEHNLDNNVLYASTYDIELAIGLVHPQEDDEAPPHARDKALNRANNRRVGERIRRDPYVEHESIGMASSRDVSPNTPKGESV